MTDRDLLDLLADDFPDPSGRLADDVIAGVARARRRRWAIVTTCAAVLVVASGAVTLAERGSPGPRSANSQPIGAGGARPSHSSAAAATPSGQSALILAEQASIYAAMIDHFAPSVLGGAGHYTAIDIRSAYCDTAATDPTATCVRRPIPPAAQHDLVAALPGYRVRFVGRTGAEGIGSQRAIVVTLAGATVRGTSATAGLEVQCGLNCAGGTTLHLSHRSGHWTVVPGGGSGWMA